MIKIAVLVKFYKGEISLFDESAIACALKVKNSEITIISMSPVIDKDRLKYYTRYGIKAKLISDDIFAGSDTLATAKILARYLGDKYDLILCGRQSFNGDTAQVPAEISALLNINFYPYVLNFSLENVNTRIGNFSVKIPCVMSLERIENLCPPSMFSKETQIEVIDNTIIKIDQSQVGLQNSETKVIKTFEKQYEYSKCEYVNKDFLDKVLQEYKNKKIQESFSINQKFNKIYFVGKELKEIASNISNSAIEITGNIDDIISVIKKEKPSIVLFPANLKYRAIAPVIAGKLNVGLCADCIKLENQDGKLIMYRPALAENTIAKIISKSDIQMATVRIKEDSSNIVFGIGYGAKDYIEDIKQLALKYNAETVCSRKIVDQDLLPYQYQVGLTGKKISPSVYVAFGVSGAVQHLAGIDNNSLIVAINKDKEQDIFKIAKYGIVIDLKDFFKKGELC